MMYYSVEDFNQFIADHGHVPLDDDDVLDIIDGPTLSLRDLHEKPPRWKRKLDRMYEIKLVEKRVQIVPRMTIETRGEV